MEFDRLGLGDEFWDRVIIAEGDGCWIWKGGLTKGYAHVGWGPVGARKTVRANRLVLAAKLGRPLAPGMFACHTCDVRMCVRPDHLFEATNRENGLDMSRKGRANRAQGCESPRAKLKREQVLAIIASQGTDKQLADVYGVSKSTIGRVRRGDCYKHDRRVIPSTVVDGMSRIGPSTREPK